MKATCRQVEAPSEAVLSYDIPVNEKPSLGNSFHCLQATSHALQPMHRVVSVKKPLTATLVPVLAFSRFVAVCSAGALPCRWNVALPGSLINCGRHWLASGVSTSPASSAGLNRSGERLGFLNRHVRVRYEADQIVRRIPPDQTIARPIVRQPDLMDDPTSGGAGES